MSEQTPHPDAPQPPRRRRRLRLALAILGAVLVIAIGAGAAAVATFDPNTLKPRIRDAVRQATGRDLALNGDIGLKLSLWPTVAVRDVSLANPAGFSRPEMASFRALELRLAVLPLLSRRVEIEELVLVGPDIRLETNAKGEPNWVMAPPAPAAAPAPVQGGGTATPALLPHVASARITEGTLVWHDGVSGRTVTLRMPSVSLRSSGAAEPLHFDADLRVQDIPLTIKAQTASLARLLAPDGPPVPVAITLASGAASLSVEGSVRDLHAAKGYDLAVRARVPDTAPLAAALPRGAIPALRDVALSARVADVGALLPAITELTLRTGVVGLPQAGGDIRIESLDLAAPGPDKPVTLAVTARAAGVPLALNGTVTHPGFDAPGTRPMRLDLTGRAGDASVTVKGSLTRPVELSGVALDLAGRIPDLTALSPLAGQKLPDIKPITFQGRLADAEGGLTQGMRLTSLALTLPAGDIAGEAGMRAGVPAAVTATLRSGRLDLDAILAALPARDAAAAPGSSAAARPARNGRLIPDDPIPFGLLQMLDADLRLAVGTMRYDGADYRDVTVRLHLDDGRLRIDPFSAQAPEGPLTATLAVDATRPQPLVHLTAQSSGITLRTLLAAMGVRAVARGQLEMAVDLSGSGETPRAIAASLSGKVGVALAGGQIDTRILGSSVGKVSRDLALLDLLGRSGGIADIRCLAVRFDAQNGLARSRVMLLNTSLLTADGGGTVDLRDETMNLTLRPHARIGAAPIQVPVTVSGPLAGPRVDVGAAGVADAAIERFGGSVVGDLLGSRLGGGTADRENCQTALALARGGTPPAAAPAADPAPAPTTGQPTTPAPQRPARPLPKLPDPGSLLRPLFR